MWLESLPEEKRAEEQPKDAERQAKFAARFANAGASAPPPNVQASDPVSPTAPSPGGLLQRMRAGLKSPVPVSPASLSPERDNSHERRESTVD